jgi:hypothetical protein
VIVNLRTAVFVTRTKHVIVARAQEVPSPNIIVPTMKFEAYYRDSPDLTSIFSQAYLRCVISTSLDKLERVKCFQQRIAIVEIVHRVYESLWHGIVVHP